MCNQTGFGSLLAIIGFVVLIASGVAWAQIEGTVQYPPLSIGEDAQPPPPARMVPKIVPPRRVELGASGSSMAPPTTAYWIHQGADHLSVQPLNGASPLPFPTGSGNN